MAYTHEVTERRKLVKLSVRSKETARNSEGGTTIHRVDCNPTQIEVWIAIQRGSQTRHTSSLTSLFLKLGSYHLFKIHCSQLPRY